MRANGTSINPSRWGWPRLPVPRAYARARERKWWASRRGPGIRPTTMTIPKEVAKTRRHAESGVAWSR